MISGDNERTSFGLEASLEEIYREGKSLNLNLINYGRLGLKVTEMLLPK